MHPEKLVRMANQIAQFFASQGNDHAAADVADHLRKFWEPRMRAQICAHLDKRRRGARSRRARGGGETCRRTADAAWPVSRRPDRPIGF